MGFTYFTDHGAYHEMWSCAPYFTFCYLGNDSTLHSEFYLNFTEQRTVMKRRRLTCQLLMVSRLRSLRRRRRETNQLRLLPLMALLPERIRRREVRRRKDITETGRAVIAQATREQDRGKTCSTHLSSQVKQSKAMY